MILSLSWLKNHLFTKANIKQVVDRLTEIGLEVESLKSSSDNIDQFTICKIIITPTAYFFFHIWIRLNILMFVKFY